MDCRRDENSSEPLMSKRESLTRLTIPNSQNHHSRSRASSSSSSLSLSSEPPSSGLFASAPVTPLTSASKSPPSRNDIFSEDRRSEPSAPGRMNGVKDQLRGQAVPSHFAYDVWDVEARRRRSGAWAWSSRTSRSSTPNAVDDSVVKVDFSNFLGKGLTSVVYSGTLPSGEIVAVKIPTNAESKQVLEREAAVISHLRSIPGSTDYIIPFYGKFSFDESFALCFELCPQTMQDYIILQSGHVPVIGLDLWKRWLSTLLSAVEFIHNSGILHNDIKPHNILLTSSLHPYLSDFAVSTPIYPLNIPFPRDMHVLGTTVYTAPELLSAEDVPTTPASDIYSLGITMFVAAMRDEPFNWTRSITQKIMLKKRGDVFAGADIHSPSRVVEIIKGMCLADPIYRWGIQKIRQAMLEL